MLIETHAHLDYPDFAHDFDDVIRRANDAGIREMIADNLSKAGWSWGCVSAIDSNGRTIFVAHAHLAGQKAAWFP
jgi:Tat protein secretion system quality control protein TatD with DNase activity